MSGLTDFVILFSTVKLAQIGWIQSSSWSLIGEIIPHVELNDMPHTNKIDWLPDEEGTQRCKHIEGDRKIRRYIGIWTLDI